MTLFAVHNLRVSYPLTSRSSQLQWAVDDVSLTLDVGERLGLVGESGCGKSTLGRAAMRLLPKGSQVEGQVNFGGEAVFEFGSDRLRRFRGEAVSLVFQDPMTRLDPLMTIGDHCVETLLAHRPDMNRSQAKDQAISTLESVRIPASRWSQYPHEFSGGMRQRVAIALALLLDPKLIVADEPTTSLDVTVAAEILKEIIRLCAERNLALLLISHDLALVSEYCPRMAVMYQGKIVETGATETILHYAQHPYTQSLLTAALHLQTSSQIKVDKVTDHEVTPLLKLTNLQQHYTLETSFIQKIFTKFSTPSNSTSSPTSLPISQVIKAVDGIDLAIYPGEILGLVGESGCGKSTLSRTILQLIRPTAGTVEFQGVDITKLSRLSLQTTRRQMQMIFQDPHACLNPLMTIGASIADPLFIHKLAIPTEAKSRVLTMLEKVGLPAEMFDRYPADISGGQQQRVAIARALITNPSLVICDEPVSMLDASVQAQVLDLMLALKQEFNLTYLFITHDLSVARFLCDRIAVMNQGKIVELEATQQIFNHPQHPYTQKLLKAAPLLAATSGFDPPTLPSSHA
jgi:peptide/nickel transport system ATP-binding protein